jgi:hypothetical protein
VSDQRHQQYTCKCGAQCTFEAMQYCPYQGASYTRCRVLRLLRAGLITDRRPDDFDPNFPSVFTRIRTRNNKNEGAQS